MRYGAGLSSRHGPGRHLLNVLRSIVIYGRAKKKTWIDEMALAQTGTYLVFRHKITDAVKMSQNQQIKN